MPPLSPLRRATLAVVLLSAATLVTLLARSPPLPAEPAAGAMLVRIAGVALRVEVANDPASRARGLMHRTELAADAGMLFVYPQPQILQFWMKNTPLDLDIGFFDAQGRLLNVSAMTAFDTRSRHVSRAPASYAVETNRGWYAAHGITDGATLELSQPVAAY